MALTLSQLRVYPGDNLHEVDQAVERQSKDEWIARVGSAPYDQTPYPNQVWAVLPDGSGPAPAGFGSGNYISFGAQPVAQFQPYVVTITTSTTLTEAAHLGAVIELNPVTLITLSLSGLTPGFKCDFVRLPAAATVALNFASLTNLHPNTHVHIASAVPAGLIVLNSGALIWGGTLP